MPSPSSSTTKSAVDPAVVAAAWFAHFVLQVGARAAAPRHGAITVADADLQLQMELAQLTQDVAELELELATAQAEVAEFTRRYYDLVGRRMVELDAVQARLAREQAERAPENPGIRAETQEKQGRAEQSARESERFTQASADEPAAFRPSADVKRLAGLSTKSVDKFVDHHVRNEPRRPPARIFHFSINFRA